MAHYKICPKCGLNYIDFDTQELCDICKKAILGQRTACDDLSLETELEEELQSPFTAKTIDRNEQYEEETQEEYADDDTATWRSFVDMDDDLEIPDFEISEELDEEEEIEEEEAEEDDDDFEYVSPDDYCAEEDDEDDDDEETDDDFSL